jgi:hypothetical protein
MKSQRGFTLLSIVLLFLPLMAIGIWGWVWNIIKIVGSDFGVITGLLVMRVIGVFLAPLGAVLGFF